MFFSKMTLDREAIISGRFRDLVTGPYQVHEMIWGLFADHPDRKRDFLYRAELRGREPVVYLLSAREPVYEGKIWSIQSKPFRPALRKGDLLSFRIRVNPVVTKTEPDPERKRVRHRHDVIMDAKRRLNEANLPFSMSDLVQQESVRWLSQRGENGGFSLFKDRVIAGGYRKMQFSHGKKKNAISISVVDCDGVLQVDDPDLFLQMLCNGLGPAKGFGCGFMMVKRAAL
ncbi:type I-E CRISPR-associated protein Cas6/Cse3/CasE [Methanospirillum sp.]|uniref:type I-E CRISPR-associated protein Cas6/Cse3/CasE n=1 Tax=Methanospirillum sp. TaxID=45200 RepID=UPI0035A12203